MATRYTGVGNPRDFEEVDYGNGVIGQRVATGNPDDPYDWLYPWRSDPYNDVLGDPEVNSQIALDTFRDANPGTVAEDDIGAMVQYMGQAPLKNGAFAGGTNAQTTAAQLQQVLDSIRGMNAQEGVSQDQLDAAAGNFPTFEVPGQNLGGAIDQTYLDQMSGSDPLGLQNILANLLQRNQQNEGGVSPQLMNRMNQARERLTQGQEAALADLRGVLADRGLISLPGAPEGSELDATQRAFLPLQRAYLDELRTAQNEEFDREDKNTLDAITAATGWSQQDAATRLAAANSAGERQRMLSDIALSVLDKNMQWNQFLAQFGLQREQLANEIRNGRIQNVLPILQMFMGLINSSRGGYV